MCTSIKSKIAIVPMNKSLVDDRVNSFSGLGTDFSRSQWPCFLPRGNDLKAVVDMQKVFVKSTKNVLTAHAV